MSAPHVWLREQIEAATGINAYPVEMTGSELPPYVVYVRDTTAREFVLPDTMEAIPEPGLLPPVATFTLTIYADSYVQAWEIAGQIVDAVHKVSADESGLTIHECVVADEKDGMAGYLEGREQPTYTVEQTIQIRWE